MTAHDHRECVATHYPERNPKPLPRRLETDGSANGDGRERWVGVLPEVSCVPIEPQAYQDDDCNNYNLYHGCKGNHFRSSEQMLPFSSSRI